MGKVISWFRGLFVNKVVSEELALEVEAAKKVIKSEGYCPGHMGCVGNNCPARHYRNGAGHPWENAKAGFYATEKIAWFKNWLKGKE